MPNEARAIKDPWHVDDTTVTESNEEMQQRVRQAEEDAAAFESGVPTRKSGLPEVLAKATRDPDVVVDEVEVIIDEDDGG